MTVFGDDDHVISKPLFLAFEHETCVVPVGALLPLKILNPDIKRTAKYKQIASSIEAVGIIEMPGRLSGALPKSRLPKH